MLDFSTPRPANADSSRLVSGTMFKLKCKLSYRSTQLTGGEKSNAVRCRCVESGSTFWGLPYPDQRITRRCIGAVVIGIGKEQPAILPITAIAGGVGCIAGTHRHTRTAFDSLTTRQPQRPNQFIGVAGRTVTRHHAGKGRDADRQKDDAHRKGDHQFNQGKAGTSNQGVHLQLLPCVRKQVVNGVLLIGNQTADQGGQAACVCVTLQRGPPGGFVVVLERKQFSTGEALLL
jgi:hypothetical protein